MHQNQLGLVTHVEVHEDRVILSSGLLCPGYSLPGNGSIRKAHQYLEKEINK